jgi:putative exosortase-associated protein (TIGR04073 family)
MKVKVVVALLISCLATLIFAGGACAGPYKNIENSSPQEIVNGMSSKATRGIANIATGWLEFPKQIYMTSQEDGAVSGIFVGPLKGLGMTIVRTLSGAAEFLTFFSAYPNFYAPYFEPAYVWQKE